MGFPLANTVKLASAALSGGPTQTAISLMFAAGGPPTNTGIAKPITGPPTWGTITVTCGHTCKLPKNAAGFGIISLDAKGVPLIVQGDINSSNHSLRHKIGSSITNLRFYRPIKPHSQDNHPLLTGATARWVSIKSSWFFKK